LSDPERSNLLGVLEESRRLGLLGPGPVERQQQHALDLARSIGPFEGEFLDLGSGGGLPGLVLLSAWPDARAVLLDAQQRRCTFLARAISRLGWEHRASVACGRAEHLARSDEFRVRFQLVVARSFGAPAVTAECAVGFLRSGGSLVVTEPPPALGDPGPSGRWDVDGLARLGFGPPESVREGGTGAVRVTALSDPAPEWPRRDGVPAKRPLW
jgi:16S rRNA (guanine527-N7)-methyltransferase